MTGADGTYDYKAMAAGIVLAGGEGMGNLLPVVEKHVLVGVERRRRFPTGDGACGIEII